MNKKIQSHVCESCGKRVRRDDMTQHRLEHLNQSSFVCHVGGCRQYLSRKCHMIRHIKSKQKDYGKDSNAGEQDSSSPSRLAPQAQFSTEAASPNTRGNESNGNILELRQENDRLRGELAQKDSKMRAAIQEKAAAEKLKASLLEQIAKDRDIAAATRRDLVADREKYRENLERWSKELDSVATRSKSLEMDDLSNIDIQTEVEEQNSIVCDLQNRLELTNRQLIEGERLRKKMHNTILDLKGNIRVFCRVRPPMPDDGVGDASVIAYPSSLEYQGRGIDLIQKGQKHTFTFDKVFSHKASQEDVFVEISELVQSAMDGYKVCIFSYGQTGSGKTYTMVGKLETLEQKGLIPRSMEQIFQISQSLLAQCWKYKMQASMLEIHNEIIYDLLSTNTEMGVQGKTYEIKQDENGNIFVSNLNIIDVSSVSEVLSLLRRATRSRFVGEISSRSHFVSTLQISGVNEVTKQRVDGVLNLVDLAGSERLQETRAIGELFKETQDINESLSSLGDVIFALAKKQRHVPFGNSKLTHLLQSCLCGDSKISMFVNISPDLASVDESLCSLRFAERINACKSGVPKRKTKRL